MNIFDKHRLKIARKTLRMSDGGAIVMGGMTKREARRVISDNCMSQAEFRRQLHQLEGTLDHIEEIDDEQAG